MIARDVTMVKLIRRAISIGAIHEFITLLMRPSYINFALDTDQKVADTSQICQNTVARGSKFVNDFFTHFLRADKNDNDKRPCAFHEKHSQHLNGISPKTVHIKKLANLTANTKH